jgi:hypothetical protein
MGRLRLPPDDRPHRASKQARPRRYRYARHARARSFASAKQPRGGPQEIGRGALRSAFDRTRRPRVEHFSSHRRGRFYDGVPRRSLLAGEIPALGSSCEVAVTRLGSGRSSVRHAAGRRGLPGIDECVGAPPRRCLPARCRCEPRPGCGRRGIDRRGARVRARAKLTGPARPGGCRPAMAAV